MNANSKAYNTSTLRRLPESTEAEQALLAAAMLGSAIEVLGVLQPDDLYDGRHQTILAAIAALYDTGRPVDLLTVTEQLRSEGKLEQAGGAAFVARIVDTVPAAGAVGWLSSQVLEKKARRQMIEAANRLARAAFEEPEIEAVREQAREALRELDAPSGKGPIFTSYRELAESEIERWERAGNKATGVPSGFTKFDKITGGFQPSDLFVLAARPGMGKSAFALCVAQNAAHHGYPVAIFSLEMSKSQLYSRQMARVARIDSQKFRLGRLSTDEWVRIAEAQESLHKLPVYIDDTPRQRLLEIQRRARWAADQLKIRLLILDYLQLLVVDRRQQRRDLEIAECTGGLKALAKELDVPVILLSQVNRSVETRDDKRPRLADLRESGAIEQDSDVVSFLYRPEYYEGPNCSCPGVAEVDIAKHRNGPTGMVRLGWVDWRCSFENI